MSQFQRPKTWPGYRGVSPVLRTTWCTETRIRIGTAPRLNGFDRGWTVLTLVLPIGFATSTEGASNECSPNSGVGYRNKSARGVRLGSLEPEHRPFPDHQARRHDLVLGTLGGWAQVVHGVRARNRD